MRWWGSNLGQGWLHPWDLLLIVMYISPNSPDSLFPNLATARGPPTIWVLPISVLASPANARGHPPTYASPVSVPASPISISSVPSATTNPYCIYFLTHILLLSSCDISSKVVLNCVSVAFWLRHASLLSPSLLRTPQNLAAAPPNVPPSPIVYLCRSYLTYLQLLPALLPPWVSPLKVVFHSNSENTLNFMTLAT